MKTNNLIYSHSIEKIYTLYKKMIPLTITRKRYTFLIICLLSVFIVCPTIKSVEINHQISYQNATNSTRTETIPYSVSGNGDTAVIFIHGFMDAGNVWEPIISQLPIENYRFVTLDLPFMGALSDWSGSISLDIMTEAVIHVVDELNIPVILVGQSMGAQIAELVSYHRSDEVKGMVFVAPVPLSGLPVSKEFIHSMKEMANNETLQRQFRQQTFPHLKPEVLDKLVKNGIRITPQNMEALIETWSQGYPVNIEFALNNTPTLIIGGEDDPVCTSDILMSSIAPRFSVRTIKFLPETGHWPHIDRPIEVAQNIKQFLINIRHNYSSSQSQQ